MSDLKEQTESIAESNACPSKSTDHRQVRRRYVRSHARHNQIMIQIRSLSRKNRRRNRRSRRQPLNSTHEMIHTGTQTDLTDDTSKIRQEIDLNDRGTVSTESRESRSEPIESVNEQALTTTHIIPMGQINSPTGSELVIFSATNESVTPFSTPRASISCPPRFDFVTQHPMKVAVSYAGENETRVKVISQLIHDKLTTPHSPFPVFYAPNFQDELAGLNGMEKLLKIYRNASLVVVFLSAAYDKSPFCEEEWRTIRHRFIYVEKGEQRQRLLFVKLSDYNAEELNLVSDDFYIDGLKMNDQDVADLIVTRWNKVENLLIQ